MGPNLRSGARVLANYRVIRFLGVGVLNTVFGYSVYAALIFAGLSYLIALFLSTIAGVVFNYFSFGRIVFFGHIGASCIYCLVFKEGRSKFHVHI